MYKNLEGVFIVKIFEDLLKAIRDCGTIMSEGELIELAYGVYGENEYIEDAEGNIVDVRRIYTLQGLQEIADIYTYGFDCINY